MVGFLKVQAVPVFNQAPKNMKMYRGMEVWLCILNLSTKGRLVVSSTQWLLGPGRKSTDTYWKRNWVDTRNGLNFVRKKKILLLLLVINPNSSIIQPIVQTYTRISKLYFISSPYRSINHYKLKFNLLPFQGWRTESGSPFQSALWPSPARGWSFWPDDCAVKRNSTWGVPLSFKPDHWPKQFGY